jgi:putative peptidoglycan lipid II flippase
LASVNLLCAILIGLTIVGEAVLGVLWLVLTRADHLLSVQLTAIMLPYVLLVCGTAFLGAILQVHGRFAAVAATSIVLNAVLIAAILLGARFYDFSTEPGLVKGVFLLSVGVLVAGAIQVLMLIPSLRAVGFRFRLVFHVLTPEVRRMLQLTLPVALSAGVLQIGVMLDKAIAFSLAEGDGATTFSLFGTSFAYPMAEGAIARLNWAQFMYQFPLGVFAIALATAIFPRLAGNALDLDKSDFRNILRKGIVASLFIGLPASIGMIAVAEPAVRLLLQHGKTTAADANWIILSTCIYSAAIWAFSLQQILSRAYFALHDTRTPMIWAILNLLINLVVEIPLIFTPLRESGMAVGTLVSFSIQSVVMTWMLSRRIGGIGLRAELRPIGVMVTSSLLMGLACWGVASLFPDEHSKTLYAIQLMALMSTGVVTYAVLCHLGGIDLLAYVRRRR